MNLERLQKIIANSGLCSRRKAEDLLREGQVKVNGRLAHLGDSADQETDEILVGNSKVKSKTYTKVLILNKPIGVISSCHDKHGRTTVLDLLPPKERNGVYPVGRLDLDSRGLIIITNNGDLTLRLTHPRYGHKKTYRVWVKGLPTNNSLKKWRNGIMLDGCKTIAAEVNLKHSDYKRSLLEIVIREGRKRQIRRVAGILGHKVIDLQRTSIGDFELNGLKEGHWRQLHKSEWSSILNLT